MMGNLMILSPGRRVYLVEQFKTALHRCGAEVITADMSKYAAALYFGDRRFVVEKDIENPRSYIEKVIALCVKQNASSILTLVDPELVLLAEYKEEFIKNGIMPVISGYSEIMNTFDKYKFFLFFKDKINVVPTYNSYAAVITALKDGSLKFPLFAKLRCGSGSAGINKLANIEELGLYRGKDEYIFQPFINFKEYGVDVYFDMLSGEISSLFIKESMSMRAGETDKAISVYRDDIVKEILELEVFNFKGPINVDVFADDSGVIYVNEINPRFGGSYPHAHFCGVDCVKSLVNNLCGVINEVNIGDYPRDVVMLKYNSEFFTPVDNLA